jgi:hypothetical protein
VGARPRRASRLAARRSCPDCNRRAAACPRRLLEHLRIGCSMCGHRLSGSGSLRAAGRAGGLRRRRRWRRRGGWNGVMPPGVSGDGRACAGGRRLSAAVANTPADVTQQPHPMACWQRAVGHPGARAAPPAGRLRASSHLSCGSTTAPQQPRRGARQPLRCTAVQTMALLVFNQAAPRPGGLRICCHHGAARCALGAGGNLMCPPKT